MGLASTILGFVAACGCECSTLVSFLEVGSAGLSNSLIQVDDDTYALAYYGNGNDGYISTFEIYPNPITDNNFASPNPIPSFFLTCL